MVPTTRVPRWWLLAAAAVAAASMSTTTAAPVAADCRANTTSAAWQAAGPAGYVGKGALLSAGAVQEVVQDPVTNAWFSASVNGGVWRTPTLDTASPAWTQVLDGSPVTCYSIAALAAGGGEVWAGCGGSTSSEEGATVSVLNDGPWLGVMVSRDGGDTWAMTAFPRHYMVTDIALVNATAVAVSARSSFFNESDGGVWVAARDAATADAAAWRRTSHRPVFSLAARSPSTLFAAVALSLHTAMVSFDAGSTFADWSTGLAWPSQQAPFYPFLAMSAGTVFLGGLTVSATNPDDTATGLFYRPLDGSAPWVAFPNVHRLDADGMPKDRAALLPDPTNATLVYVVGNGGDVAYRVAYAAGEWTSMLGGDTADGSAPHVDCRSLAWDAGRLVLTSDGGVFVRHQPGAPGGTWASLNGNVTEVEFLSASWDGSARRFIAGAQDNDVQVSVAGASPGQPATGVVLGDGCVTLADNTASPPRLFGARQFLGVGPDDAHGTTTGGDDDDGGGLGAGMVMVQGNDTLPLALNKLGFGGATCFPFFVHPVALHANTPTGLLFWANCTTAGGDGPGVFTLPIPHGTTSPSALKPPTLTLATHGDVYQFVAGGVTRGKPDPSVFVAMNGSHLLHRAGGAKQPTARRLPVTFAAPVVLRVADGAVVLGPVSHDKTVSLAVSPADSSVVAVTGWPSVTVNAAPESVWVTTDGGASWVNATGNLRAAVGNGEAVRPSGLRWVPGVPVNATAATSALLVGTTAGVYVSWADAVGVWHRLGSCAQLPLCMVKDVSYDAVSDTLVAASMGRGVFVLEGARAALAAAAQQRL